MSDDLQQRIERMDQLVRHLENALSVEAALASRSQARHEQWLTDHERWLEDHQRAMVLHNQAMQEHKQNMLDLDKKLDRIADMMGFRGGNGEGKG